MTALAIASGAQAETTYSFQLGGSYLHDDNLFRQDKAAPATGPRSDDIRDITGNGDLDLSFGQLEGHLQSTASYNYYRRNSDLNNFSYSLTGRLQRPEDGIAGFIINGSTQQRLSSFADVQSRIRNLQSLQQISGNATLAFSPEFRIVLTPEFTQSTNSVPAVQSNDYRRYGSGVGFGYFTSLGNSIAITLTRRYTSGLSPRTVFLSGSFVGAPIDVIDTSADLRLTYNIGPITKIESVLSYLRRDDHSVLHDNYSGPSGQLTITYMPRNTLRVQFMLERRLDSVSLLFVDSLKTNHAEARFEALVLDRWRLKAVSSYQRRKFSYDPISGLGQSNRTDNDFLLHIESSYVFAHRLQLAAVIERSWRDSNVEFGNFHSNIFQISLAFLFGNSDRSDKLTSE